MAVPMGSTASEGAASRGKGTCVVAFVVAFPLDPELGPAVSAGFPFCLAFTAEVPVARNVMLEELKAIASITGELLWRTGSTVAAGGIDGRDGLELVASTIGGVCGGVLIVGRSAGFCSSGERSAAGYAGNGVAGMVVAVETDIVAIVSGLTGEAAMVEAVTEVTGYGVPGMLAALA
jgi:hypothetical protein